MLFSRRFSNLFAAIGCFVLIAVAYFYMEKTLYLIPCPLCYAQRIALAIIGFFFLMAALFPGKNGIAKAHGIWLFLLSSGGAALSIRHIYIQHLPKDAIPNCGQDFYGLFQNTPLSNVIETMLLGSGDCGEIQWVFMGLSIPGWTLIVFIGLGFWGLFHNYFRR